MENAQIEQAMRFRLTELPEYPAFTEGIRRAPKREAKLLDADVALALKNALRYIPAEFHEQMAAEVSDRAARARAHLRLPVPPRGRDHRQAHRQL